MKSINNKRRYGIWIFVFAFLFSVGFAAGGFVQKSDRISGTIATYTFNLVDSRLSHEALAIFTDSVLPYFVILVVICFFAVTRAGLLLNSCIVLCLGLGDGALVSAIACDSGFSGMGFSLIVLLPGMIASGCAIIMLAARLTELSSDGDRRLWFCRKQGLASLFIYIFVIIFSGGLDVTFSVIYKAVAPV